MNEQNTDMEKIETRGRKVMYGDGVVTEQKRITLPAEMWQDIQNEFADHRKSAASVGIHAIVSDWQKRQKRKLARQQKQNEN